MLMQPLDVTVRINFDGGFATTQLADTCHNLYSKYSIFIEIHKPYRFLNTHAVSMPGKISYQRRSIMQHVYSKGLFENGKGFLKKRYFIDVVVYPDGSMVFQRF